MSTSVDEASARSIADENINGDHGNDDPFSMETPPAHPHQHRFSAFDTQLFALNHPSSSPAQAKKALEAHLADTDRRIQETSKLGTTLVQQRVSLSNRLREVATQGEDSKIGPELRQKLIDIEREYNEVGRQSAKAFLGPRSDTPGEGTPFALDGRNPTSPTKFSSQATDSPSKVNVPRKQRNQASNSDHIEFAAEITTSLLGQVRHLQAVLAERDDALKTVNTEKSKLELDAEGFTQRLRHLDDNEQRYKDENWNLETQLQEMQAGAREAAHRENRLQQTLTATTSEKNAAQRELDDLKQNHGRVLEEHNSLRKGQESELATLRRSVNSGESEKGVMQRKIDELTSQNQELAKGLAARFRDEEAGPATDLHNDSEEFPLDLSEREHSPPPSPTKANQRYSLLETETLKSSLNHAHRMIQNLKSNVHREKAEKQDLKRMLQEARDELEIRRAEPSEKRLKSRSQQDIRRAARPLLGATRSSRTDVMVDDPEHDPDWEDHNDASLYPEPSLRSVDKARSPQFPDANDAYQTANETEDAFETANERDTTDNDAFQTGAESLAGDSSDDMTETESGAGRGRTNRGKKVLPHVSTKPGDRRSLQSTASTSDDDAGIYTPIHGQPQRFRLKLNRNARRSRASGEIMRSSPPASAKDSPASFANAGGEGGQSLFAELENISGDDADGTPSRRSMSSHRSSQSLRRTISDKRSSSSIRRSTGSQSSNLGFRSSALAGEVPPVPKIPTVDSGMMTEPWEPTRTDSEDADLTQVEAGHASAGATDPALGSPGTLLTNSAMAITSRIFGGTPSTPENKAPESQPGSRLASNSTSTSTPPRPVWDQPLQMFSGVIPGFNQSKDTTPLSLRSASSQAQEDPTSERSLQGAASKTAEAPLLPSLSFSPIQSLETTPKQPFEGPVQAERFSIGKPAGSPGHKSMESSSGSILSVFGWRKSSAAHSPEIARDETSQDFAQAPPSIDKEGMSPPQEVPANVVARGVQDTKATRSGNEAALVYKADQASQTLLSSEHIDNLLLEKDTPPPLDIHKVPSSTAMKPLSEIGAILPPLSTRSFPENDPIGKGKAPEMVAYRDSLGKNFKRPTSATSIRSRMAQYPPLPPDHQEAIAAAQKAPESMGPPTAPASAYPRSTRSRAGSRPQTPSQHGFATISTKGGTTPRAGRYSVARSQVSRRSSVSSFASELDERFNIRQDGMPLPGGMQSGTDPRMIQAITQTMIGEMMWKYTRKAGRGEMSNTRHRRFFWVHPYTRTLYWSDRDPATANRAELKSKSVAIEAVRVVIDDNPMPPGLHRKSLIIVTPGRSVKFTAQTSQRHETWFNALSYLLLRTRPDGSTYNGDMTDADLEEFNPGYYNRRSGRSRVSLASFKSHATQNRNVRSSLSNRAPAAVASSSQTHLEHLAEFEDEDRASTSIRQRISRSLSRNRHNKASRRSQSRQGESSNTNTGHHASIGSRISGYWSQKQSIRASMRSRSSMRENSIVEPGVLEGGRSIISASGADSAEDLRRVIEQRESRGDLENVRACCDGRHDVGSLTKNSRHHSHAGSTHSMNSHHSTSLTNLAYGM